MRLSAVYTATFFLVVLQGREVWRAGEPRPVLPATSAIAAGRQVVEMGFPPSETSLEIKFHFRSSQKLIYMWKRLDDVTKSNRRRIISNGRNAWRFSSHSTHIWRNQPHEFVKEILRGKTVCIIIYLLRKFILQEKFAFYLETFLYLTRRKL